MLKKWECKDTEYRGLEYGREQKSQRFKVEYEKNKFEA
jgi:hypothetical protein